MGKGAVRVLLRTRPTEAFAVKSLKLQEADTVGFFLPKKSGSGVLNNTQENYCFKYDGVLHNATQEEVYETGCRALVDSVIQGYNGTALAYGQTGAGKTYTMTGGGTYTTRGLIPRAVADLFRDMAHLPEKAFEVCVSYMEIYNERIFDLLAEDEGGELTVHDDATHGVTVKGLELKPTASETEALAHLFKGNQRRVVGQHVLNDQSSRSHCIFTLHVRSRSRVESDGHALASKLNLVDLAGSERVSKTGSEGVVLREAMHINKSLSFLEQVVVALSASSRGHVPYRQCKLTNILKDSLGGNCKTVMVANVWGEERYLDETFSTLKFAARMMKVQNEAQVNVTTDASSQIRQLQKQIQELKAELQMQNQLHGKSHIKYDGFSDDERYELEKKVQQYLAGTLEDIEVRSLRDVKEYFKLFKACCDRAGIDAQDAARHDNAEHDAAAKGAGQQGAGQHGAAGGVGDVDAGQGFGVGTGAAARNIRATMGVSPQWPANAPVEPAEGTPGVPKLTPPTAASGKSLKLPDRNSAYDDYKENEAAEQNATLKELGGRLRQLKADAMPLTQQANELKTQVEELRTTLERYQQEDDDASDIVDADRMQLYEELKAKKNNYRDMQDQLLRMKREHGSTQQALNECRRQLVAGFETWYAQTYSDGAPNAQDASVPHVSERLDADERFALLEEERLMKEDPDSLQFYRAQKMSRRTGQQSTKRGAGYVVARSR